MIDEAAQPSTHQSVKLDGRERRKTPRIEMLGQIFGQALSVDTPVTVLDLSMGGFSVETACAFRTGSHHQFRFALEHGASMIITAEVVHCRHRTAPSGKDLFVTGLKFLENPDTSAAVTHIIDSIVGNPPTR